MRRVVSRRASWMAIGVLMAGVGVVGCGSGDTASGGGGSAASANATSGKRLKIIAVSSNPSSNPVGAVINNGLIAAGKEYGIDVEYRATKTLNVTSPSEEKRLIQNAIATKPDGLVIFDTAPEALNPTIRSAVESGIPVVLTSTGAGQAKATGALTYVGNDETAAGKLGGALLGKAGAKHALLLTIPPGVPIVDERNSGFEQGFPGKVTKLAVKDFNDVTGVTKAILASLQKDPSIDGVFDVGSALTPAELAAYKQLGDKAKRIKWGALDIDPQVLTAVKDGRLTFALDQQPYLQGYMPVLYLKQYLELGLKPVLPEIPTGPSVVTAENVDQVIDLAAKKVR